MRDEHGGPLTFEENSSILSSPQSPSLPEEERQKGRVSRVNTFVTRWNEHLRRGPAVGLKAEDPSPTAPDASRELALRIVKKLVRQWLVKTGWNEFMPAGEIDNFVTGNAISDILGGRGQQELSCYFLEHGKRVFLTALIICNDANQLTEVLSGFHHYGMTDAQMPIAKRACRMLQGDTVHSCDHQESSPLIAFHDPVWQALYLGPQSAHEQKKFCCPVFSNEVFIYHLEEDSILPFTSYNNREMREGKFRQVSKQILHRDHHPDQPISDTPVELKTFKRPPGQPDYDLDFIWLNEGPIEYRVISEWTDGGNLGELWEAGNLGKFNPALVMDVLQQLCGLADALCVLHYPRGSESTDQRSPDFTYWCAADIKPERILRFTTNRNVSMPPTWLGKLKVGPLEPPEYSYGNSLAEPTRYDAPEAITDLETARSRRFDVWSMGCVIFEFIILLLYGKKWLWEFYSDFEPTATGSQKKTTRTTYFTTDSGNGANVSSVFSHWVEQVLRHPECSDYLGRQALGDLVRLVRDRLLVVNLPGDGQDTTQKWDDCREDARELKEQLDNIYQKARDVKHYVLCVGFNRVAELGPSLLSQGGTRVERMVPR
ncbi:hypothetical protein QBC44DRAFT_370370 [Cladorrhinum sp. PSN332]|nr:hypothetical protein QBC44DRAFT_370370 [Cladorrhinum sp. PSN332]